ncbi:MAG: metal ABC transporter substrate-binding protein [Candidatus Krumholzibacteria bacterium]|nr:metal ABC transporter substrate-binding protein [Candidatus Krumholzibacteria bacterium]
MKTNIVLSLVALLAALFPVPYAAAKVRIVTSTMDLASIAQAIGGANVEVTSLAKGRSDPHYVEVLPSYMVKVSKAQIYLKVGLDLDRWADQIIDGSRNSRLIVVDCSGGVAPLNVPTGKIDASMGDVHPRGNPHYWLDPENGLVIAGSVVAALQRVDAAHASDYQAGYERFESLLRAKQREWALVVERVRGMEIVTFHDTWPYFCAAFGIEVQGFVEPKPGIEPTPSHTAGIIELIKAREITVIGVEPYFSARTADVIARETGARVVTLPPSVGGVEGADGYFELFDVLLATLAREGGR